MSESSGLDSRQLTPFPQAGLDPDDPNKPRYDDRDGSIAPGSNPTADMDDDISDNDSILSDVDEAQFEDFDPANVAIDDRPAIAVDEDNVKLLGRHKRKRDGELGDAEGAKKKRKEGRREKIKKSRKKKSTDDEDDFSGGQELEGKRFRKRKVSAPEGSSARKEKIRARKAIPENEDALDPEERRRRALDRAMDAALKNPSKRRRKADGIDLTSMIDDEIASLRSRMSEAAELDVEARSQKPPRPAMHKLRLLPEVTALLNRNNRDVESAIVDPENNLLESVRFFLEPLSDGSLPAYNIQRELFASLARLPIDKEALISSGVGKVVLFYTKSKKPEISIKRQAERLLGDWTRPILKRSDDYHKRVLDTAEYDPTARLLNPNGTSSKPLSQSELAAQAREQALAPPVKNPNRARMQTSNTSYSVVPLVTRLEGGVFARPLGASGEDAFRRMKARQTVQSGKGPKR